jgi:FMN phosphatase YigB (HAD superfamily)
MNTIPIKAIVFDMYGVLYDGAKFNDGLLIVVKTLKPFYKIGLLSNISKSRLDELLADPAIADLFDATLASSECTFNKPHPELFHTIAERLAVPLEEMLFIDDSEDNIAGAAFLGVRAHPYRDTATLIAWLESHDVMASVQIKH